MTSPLSQSIIFHVAGALNDHEDERRGGQHRDAHYVGGFAATWPPGATSDPHVAWARDGWCGSGPSPPAPTTSTSSWPRMTAPGPAACGNNYQRLQRAKATYDPDDRFRINRDIPPAP